MSKLKKVAKKVLKSPIGQIGIPLALSAFAPGLGTALGAGLGVGSAYASTAGNALIGAGLGAASGGGIKGALKGGVSAGLGSALSSSTLGNSLIKGSGVVGPTGPTQGSGIFGGIGRGLNSLGSATQSSFSAPKLSTALSGIQSYLAQDDMEDKLLSAQRRSEGILQPYFQTGQNANNLLSERLQAGFNPGDLENDPGYQFEKNQGLKTLDRASAARGNFYSGSALKDAASFSNDLSTRTYNNAYDQWLQRNQQIAGQAGSGLSAAGAMTNVFDNQGNIGANAIAGKTNTVNSTLSNLFGGGIGNIETDGSVNDPAYQEYLRKKQQGLI